MSFKPEISVLMPVYNGEKYIKDAIESILSQSFREFELVILDDGSTDNTLNIIKSFKDDRIKLHVNENNKGIVYTRNKLFELANADYWAIHDADDLSYPERFKEQYNFFKNNPSYGLCGTWVDAIDYKSVSKKKWTFFCEHEEIRTEFLFMNHMVTSSVMLNRKAIPIEVSFDPNYPVSEDFHLWVRMAETCKIHILPKRLTKYRSHEMGISKVQKELIHHKIFEVILIQILKIVPDISEKEKRLHYALCFKDSLEANDTYSELIAWINKLITQNKISNYVKQELLIERLYYHCFLFLKKNASKKDTLLKALKFKNLSLRKRMNYIKSALRK